MTVWVEEKTEEEAEEEAEAEEGTGGSPYMGTGILTLMIRDS